MTNEIKAKEARELLLSEYQAILSTHSVDIEGYPFGSVVPYCMNKEGIPIILISAIAQHTKNILSNAKVSLIAVDSGADDLQTVGRITYIGNAEKLNENAVGSSERYYRYFPQSRDYHLTHDFDFYLIQPVRIRYIGGFGQIYWVEKEDFILTNPFSYEEEKDMIEHMNSDHAEAIKHYCEQNNIALTSEDMPVMTGIDSEGFNIRNNSRIYRLNFSEQVSTTMDVRKALVEMVRS